MSIFDWVYALCPRCGERQYNIPPGWTDRSDFWWCSDCLHEKCATAYGRAS